MKLVKRWGSTLLMLSCMALITHLAQAQSITFDDMEHCDPLANGWFFFGGSVGGGGISVNTADLPPMNGGTCSLETGWGSGGTPGFYGGFGRTLPTDLTGMDRFNLWINPDAGQDYTLEINFQDDDNGDNNVPCTDGADDEFQFNCTISPTGTCATAGGGWQQVEILFTSLFDDNSFCTGGNGVFDPFPVVPPAQGQDALVNGVLINIVKAVIGNTGSDASFRTDNWVFSAGPLPVEFVSFNALTDGNSAMLTWDTASETDNAGFHVETRHGTSLSGAPHTDGVWQTIGFVEGAGTTTEPQAYTYRVDDLAPGRHQFRLKQVDFDGAFEYTPVAEVTVDVPGTHFLTDAYPNPFNPQAQFALTVARDQQVKVELYDALGRMTRSLFTGELQGNVSQTININAAGLPSGTYLYRVSGENFTDSRLITLMK